MMLRSVSPVSPGLVVSIHDVSPHTWEVVKAMTSDLRALGVGHVSHLVVPDHHHRGSIADYPDFCAWLRDEAACGNEIVAHGYYHMRPPSDRESILTRWITSSYTAGEGEFFDLGFDEAKCRSARTGELLNLAGVQARGFIAPAWLLGDDATRGVRDAGYEYTTRLTTVDDWVAGVSYRSQSLVYSVRAAWRRVVSLGWNESLAILLNRGPLVRLGLHPPDWKYPPIRAHAARCITRALADREAITYSQWLTNQRSHSQGK